MQTSPSLNADAQSSSSATNRRTLVRFMLITLLYLVAEMIYNAGVVRMLSTPGITKETIEGMEVVGKAMAAIGITLFISRLVALGRTWMYLLLAALIYAGLGLAVDRFIDSIPAPSKVAGHWLGLYRVAVLERRVEDHELFRPLAAPLVPQRIALANIALLAHADRADIQQASIRYIQGVVSKEFRTSRLNAGFAEFWRSYSVASSKLRPVWARYHKANPRASVLDFMNNVRLGGMAGQRFDSYRSTVLYPGNPEIGIERVTAGDIPLFESRAAVYARFVRFTADSKKTTIDHFMPDEARSNTGVTRDLASSVFIPPISMTLSLFSIMLNVASLAGMLLVFVATAVKPMTPVHADWLFRGASTLAFATLFALTGASPFGEGGSFAEAYDKLSGAEPHQWIWKQALSREATVLGVVSMSPSMLDLADKLPGLGTWISK